MPFSLDVTDKLLTTTRAVRKRLDLIRSVEPDVVLDCIRISQQAPTGSNAQGWRWLVVTDADKRMRLAELYRRARKGYVARGQGQPEVAGNAQGPACAPLRSTSRSTCTRSRST